MLQQLASFYFNIYFSTCGLEPTSSDVDIVDSLYTVILYMVLRRKKEF